MTITAEQIVDRMCGDYSDIVPSEYDIAEAQSILDAIQAEATAAAYGAAATEARRYAEFYPQGSDGQNTFAILAEYCERQTPADATAWLAARDAAQFKAGREAALKGAVKGWAVFNKDDNVAAAFLKERDAGIRRFDHGGVFIRPCLILVGEGE